MPKRKGSGGIRTVVQLSQENFLAVHTALTLPGEVKPSFGSMSKFFNELCDNWRFQRALKETQK